MNSIKNPVLKLFVLLFIISSNIPVATSQETADSAYRFNHGPYLQGLTSNSVFVYFSSSSNGFSWIDLKPSGSKNFSRHVSIDDGLIEANNTKNAILLKELSPDTEYEYRTVSIPILQFRLSQNIYGDTIRSPWYKFKTLNPDATCCSFITTSDIHDDAEKLNRLLSYMPLDSVEMVFLLGDILSHFSREGQPYSSFIDVSVEKFAKEKPFVLVRGNHDTRGRLARTYPEYIYRPNNHFYGTYQLGDTYIILLDTGEDKEDSHHDYSGITAFEAYRTEQAEWLKKIISSQEFKKAKRRVVLAHIPPMARGESTRASRHTSDVLYRTYLPILNQANINLIVCGHTHRFQLMKPTKETAYNFPILINDNKSISYFHAGPEGISVKTVNEEGEVTLNEVF
ncbi:MAG: metallophosphoesterase [Bacteroidales bacterium]|nr:metallophosphoesterase [Bacteroidales bacterium]